MGKPKCAAVGLMRKGYNLEANIPAADYAKIMGSAPPAHSPVLPANDKIVLPAKEDAGPGAKSEPSSDSEWERLFPDGRRRLLTETEKTHRAMRQILKRKSS